MAKMMNANTKKGLCECPDCLNGPSPVGRAAEKRQWVKESRVELNQERNVRD